VSGRGKRRLSVSVRPACVEAASSAVAGGQAASVSAWVDDALRIKIEHDRRLAALAAFVASYEAEQGEITVEEIRVAARSAHRRAATVRGPAKRRARVGRR
jgi:hypothetical protein